MLFSNVSITEILCQHVFDGGTVVVTVNDYQLEKDSNNINNIVYELLGQSGGTEEKGLEDLESKYSKELLDQAFAYYNSTIDYLHDPNAEKLDDIMYEIMCAIDGAIDKDRESTYPIKVARYELNEAFESLINSIYPKKEQGL